MQYFENGNKTKTKQFNQIDIDSPSIMCRKIYPFWMCYCFVFCCFFFILGFGDISYLCSFVKRPFLVFVLIYGGINLFLITRNEHIHATPRCAVVSVLLELVCTARSDVLNSLAHTFTPTFWHQMDVNDRVFVSICVCVCV